MAENERPPSKNRLRAAAVFVGKGLVLVLPAACGPLSAVAMHQVPALESIVVVTALVSLISGFLVLATWLRGPTFVVASFVWSAASVVLYMVLGFGTACGVYHACP